MGNTAINDRDILATFVGFADTIKNDGGLDWVTYYPPTPPSKAPGDRYFIASTGAYGGGGFRVGILDNGGLMRPNFTVDVTAPNRYERDAKVNWGSSGAKSTDDARLFASVLSLAADVADKVNDAVKVASLTVGGSDA